MSGAGDLSAVVSARLCHDLVSPLGAIGNGIELIQMNGGGSGTAELALISDSLDNALGKLRFLRVAFGPAEAAATLAVEDAAEISRAALPARFSITWASEVKAMPRPLARLVFLVLLCLEKSLPLGGTVRIDAACDSAALSVEARRVSAPPELWAHVTDGAPLAPATSDTVQFALLRRGLVALDGMLAASFGSDGALLRLSVPAPLPA